MADTLRNVPEPDVYEEDFYVWTQAQAALLIELARAGKLPDGLDGERLAEEIGDLGLSERRAAESLAQRIIEHLFKLAWTGRDEPVRGWRKEIRAWRPTLSRSFRRQPSLRAALERDLEALHADALAAILEDFLIDEPHCAPDLSRRWSLAQILGEADDPLGA